jgi:hypothetical protein
LPYAVINVLVILLQIMSHALHLTLQPLHLFGLCPKRCYLLTELLLKCQHLRAKLGMKPPLSHRCSTFGEGLHLFLDLAQTL